MDAHPFNQPYFDFYAPQTPQRRPLRRKAEDIPAHEMRRLYDLTQNVNRRFSMLGIGSTETMLGAPKNSILHPLPPMNKKHITQEEAMQMKMLKKQQRQNEKNQTDFVAKYLGYEQQESASDSPETAALQIPLLELVNNKPNEPHARKTPDSRSPSEGRQVALSSSSSSIVAEMTTQPMVSHYTSQNEILANRPFPSSSNGRPSAVAESATSFHYPGQINEVDMV